ncbi:MAG: hypothetical protein WCK10_00470 [Candidatus Staskawiczbacteria bacterium]
MDITSLIQIVIIVAVAFFLLKFIISPLMKAVIGIITLLVVIYLLQRFLGVDIAKSLAPLGISWDAAWLNWLTGPINYLIDKVSPFFQFAWGNVPK